MAPKKKGEEKEGYQLEMRFGRTKANLKMGVVGLPNVGKSSFFNLLTKQSIDAANFPFCTIKPNEGRVKLPDERFDTLCKMYKPKSEVPAYLNVTDIAGLVRGASEGEGLGNEFLSHIQAVDGIFHMVRLFENDEVTHVDDSVDPVRDLDTITAELCIKDRSYLDSVRLAYETQMRKANKKLDDKDAVAIIAVFDKIQGFLTENKILSKQSWTPIEVEKINDMAPRLITIKPVVYLLNMSEDKYISKKSKWLKKVFDWINAHGGGTIIPYSVELEERIAEAEGDEAALKTIEEEGGKSNLNKIIRTGFTELNLINFFTSGEDEVRAWTIYKGATAPNAAGAIHGDMEKCFIKAEVAKYADFLEHQSAGAKVSMAGVKSAGKYKQEGKTYMVEDGDIITIMHNAKK